MTFNILADSLAKNEFLSEGGDEVSISWEIRGPKIINILNNMLKKCHVVATQENDKFEEILNALPKNISAVYYQQNNIAIFYDNEKLELLNSFYLKSKCLRCDFLINNKLINIYASHLKSGENLSSEMKRISQLTEIFEDSLDLENPIILMDSNNSYLYKMEYEPEDRLSTLIEKYNFKN